MQIVSSAHTMHSEISQNINACDLVNIQSKVLLNNDVYLFYSSASFIVYVCNKTITTYFVNESTNYLLCKYVQFAQLINGSCDI